METRSREKMRKIERKGLLPNRVRVQLDMNLAIHRLLTFPREFLKHRDDLMALAKELVASGIYFSPDLKTVCCLYCDLEIDSGNLMTYQNSLCAFNSCCQTGEQKNLPLPLDTDTMPQHLLQFEAFRLVTLLKYTKEWPVCPYELAKTGFYKSGKDCEDKCVCHSCGMTVNKWEPQDTAQGEHKRLCKEIRLRCKMLEGQADNIPIGKEGEMARISHDSVARENVGTTTFDDLQEPVNDINDADDAPHAPGHEDGLMQRLLRWLCNYFDQ